MRCCPTLALVVPVLLLAINARGEIKTQTIDYQAGGTKLRGFLAFDDSSQDKKPAVLILPEWWGLTDYPKSRAQQLAKLGYIAFAADMYGDGKSTDDPKQAGTWAGEVRKDPQVELERAQAALDVLKKQPNVDPEKIAAIGYCFGGGIALDMARSNMGVAGIVSFHGSLGSQVQAKEQIKPHVLVLNGGADKGVTDAAKQKLRDEMSKAGADFQMIDYPGALHAFTNPDADRHKMDNIKYNADADHKSWDEMLKFFKKVLGS